MKFLTFFLLFLLKAHSVVLSQWQEIEVPLHDASMRHIVSINDTLILQTGMNSFFRGNDGSWERIQIGDPNDSFLNMFVIDKKLFVYSITKRALYRSDDVGRTWAIYSIPTFKEIPNPEFSYSGKYMYATGINNNSIFISNNYGETWIERKTPTDTNCRLSFASFDSLIIAREFCTNSNQLFFFISKDLGNNWKRFDLEEFMDTRLIVPVGITRSDNVLILNLRNVLYKSTNNGTSWERIIIDTNLISETELFSSSNISFDISNQTILLKIIGNNSNKFTCLKSTDLGVTWFKNVNGLLGSLSIYENLGISSSYIYSIGYDSTYNYKYLYKQSFKDSTWQVLNLGSITPNNVNIINGHIYLSQNGYLLKSVDNGLSWKKVDTKFIINYSTFFHSNNTFIFTALDSNNFISFNKGVSWTLLESLKGFKIVEMIELNGSVMFKTYDNDVYITKDLLKNDHKLLTKGALSIASTVDKFFISYYKNVISDTKLYRGEFDKNGNLIKEFVWKTQGSGYISNNIEIKGKNFFLSSNYSSYKELLCLTDTIERKINAKANVIGLFHQDTILYTLNQLNDYQYVVYKSINEGKTWDSITNCNFDYPIWANKLGNNFAIDSSVIITIGKNILRFDIYNENLIQIDTVPNWVNNIGYDNNFVYSTEFLYKKPIKQLLNPFLKISNPEHQIFCSNQILQFQVFKIGNNLDNTECDIELSDGFGNFNKPIILGRGNIKDSITFTCRMPKNIQEGYNYRVRATAKDKISIANPIDITVPKTYSLTIKGLNKVKPSDESIYSISQLNGYKYDWNIVSGDALITNKSKNVISVKFGEQGFVKIKVECESPEGCIDVQYYIVEVMTDTNSTTSLSNPFYVSNNNVPVGTDHIVINFYRNLDNVEVELIDILGNLRGKQTINSITNELQIPINYLSVGVYFVRIKSKDQYFIDKVLIN